MHVGVYAHAFAPCIKVRTCVLNKSTSTGTRGGKRGSYINAALGECLGSTAQHILCQRPSETAFYGRVWRGKVRRRTMIVCLLFFFISSHNCSPSPQNGFQTFDHAGRRTRARIYDATRMYPRSSNMSMTGRCVGFFFPQIMEMSALILDVFNWTGKIFNFRERL